MALRYCTWHTEAAVQAVVRSLEVSAGALHYMQRTAAQGSIYAIRLVYALGP